MISRASAVNGNCNNDSSPSLHCSQNSFDNALTDTKENQRNPSQSNFLTANAKILTPSLIVPAAKKSNLLATDVKATTPKLQLSENLIQKPLATLMLESNNLKEASIFPTKVVNKPFSPFRALLTPIAKRLRRK